MYSNMVLLTVVTTSNPHTLYFDHPIEKPNYIRLLSASLYNSWYNLTENAAIVQILLIPHWMLNYFQDITLSMT